METLSSDELAPCWVVKNLQSCSEETVWRGPWPKDVCRGAFYYPIAVKPGCRQSHRQTHEKAVIQWGTCYPPQRKFPKEISHTIFRRL